MKELDPSYEYVGILKSYITPLHAGYNGPEGKFWSNGFRGLRGDWRISKPISKEDFYKIRSFAFLQKAICIRGIMDILSAIKPRPMRMIAVECIGKILDHTGVQWVWYLDGDTLLFLPPEKYMFAPLYRLNMLLLKDPDEY